MLVFLVVLLMIALLIRVYFYELSSGIKSKNILISILRRLYSFKYLLPTYQSNIDSEQTKDYKRKSNLFLYCFYFLFLVVILYAYLNRWWKIVVYDDLKNHGKLIIE